MCMRLVDIVLRGVCIRIPYFRNLVLDSLPDIVPAVFSRLTLTQWFLTDVRMLN